MIMDVIIALYVGTVTDVRLLASQKVAAKWYLYGVFVYVCMNVFGYVQTGIGVSWRSTYVEKYITHRTRNSGKPPCSGEDKSIHMMLAPP